MDGRTALLFALLSTGCVSTPQTTGNSEGKTETNKVEAPAPPGEATNNGVDPVAPRLRAARYDACESTGKVDLPIRIRDEARIVRDPPLTRFVVPLGKQANVRSLNGLAVFDEKNRRLPAQFETLSRWGVHPDQCDQPIRYAHALVSATPGPGRDVVWRVRSGQEPKEMSPLALEEKPEHWVIDTGVARFTVRRDRFEGLSKVELPRAGGGYELVSALKPETGSSSFFIDHGGLSIMATSPTWKLQLERAGPQVVTVVARGYYPGRSKKPRRKGPNPKRGLGFTVRLHFHARSSIVKVEHTYYYGQVADWGATGLTNTTVVKRAWMSIPLAQPAKKIFVRGDEDIFTLDAKQVVQLEQVKRGPGRPDVQYVLYEGEKTRETGEWARHPFMAATTDQHYVLATIAHLAHRDPQGFTWSHELGSLDLDFTSSPLGIGAARGIWSVAALDFGRGAPTLERVEALQRFAERPLLGAPLPDALVGTKTLGPYASSGSGVAGTYADLAENIHERTADYLSRLQITGVQIWPDLPTSSCELESNCGEWAGYYYGGGDNNYWNWSKVGFDSFFATAEDRFVHDFPLAEAITYVEALAVRPDHHHLSDSSVAGLAPCYGDAMGYDRRYIEGTNNRRDRCPADYAYDKTLKHAFLATGDFRFVDFFEEAGLGVVNIFGKPPKTPEPYLELTLSRLSEQRLELLANGAEFARDPEVSKVLNQKLRAYADHMVGRTLIDGHACDTGGTGQHDVKRVGECNSAVGWMMPVGTEWAIRTSRYLGHAGLRSWVLAYARQAATHHGLGKNGKPSSGRSDWRTGYSCKVDKKGKVSRCEPWSTGENNSRFYNNGMLAFLNVFGLILAEEPSDPHGICEWLPGAYRSQLAGLGFSDLNGFIWGKQSGQALALAGEAVGAISRCK